MDGKNKEQMFCEKLLSINTVEETEDIKKLVSDKRQEVKQQSFNNQPYQKNSNQLQDELSLSKPQNKSFIIFSKKNSQSNIAISPTISPNSMSPKQEKQEFQKEKSFILQQKQLNLLNAYLLSADLQTLQTKQRYNLYKFNNYKTFNQNNSQFDEYLEYLRDDYKYQFVSSLGGIHKCYIIDIKNIQQYSFLLQQLQILRQLIDSKILKKTNKKLTKLVVDFIQDKNNKWYLINIRILKITNQTNLKVTANNDQKVSTILSNSFSVYGGAGGEKKRKIMCCGDYCQLLDLFTTSGNNQGIQQLQFDPQFKQSIIDLLNIQTSKGSDLNFKKVADGSLNDEVPMEVSFQYKIMRKTIIEDRNDPNSLFGRINKINKKTNQDQKNEKVQNDLMMIYELVPVCVTCFKIYKDQEIHKQRKTFHQNIQHNNNYFKSKRRKSPETPQTQDAMDCVLTEEDYNKSLKTLKPKLNKIMQLQNISYQTLPQSNTKTIESTPVKEN